MTIHTSEAMGFVRVACLTADLLRRVDAVQPHSTLTDLSGSFGEPTIFTEWGIEATDGTTRVVMREIRWPDNPGRDCEHWIPKPGFDYKAWRADESLCRDPEQREKPESAYHKVIDQMLEKYEAFDDDPLLDALVDIVMASEFMAEHDALIAAQVRAETLDDAISVCQQIIDDASYPNSGPGVATARIVFEERAARAVLYHPEENGDK